MIAHVGAEVRRVRMGVGHPGDKSRVMPYVLSEFAKADEVLARRPDRCLFARSAVTVVRWG